VPLSAAHGSRLMLPGLYGVGTAAPVVAFSLLMAFAAQHVGRAFHRLTQVEFWVRTVTGAVFILVGIYYCPTHIYGLSLLGGQALRRKGRRADTESRPKPRACGDARAASRKGDKPWHRN